MDPTLTKIGVGHWEYQGWDLRRLSQYRWRATQGNDRIDKPTLGECRRAIDTLAGIREIQPRKEFL